MKDIRDYGLLEHNTFGIAASCKRFLEYSSIQEAVDVVSQLTDEDRPLLIIRLYMVLKLNRQAMIISFVVVLESFLIT